MKVNWRIEKLVLKMKINYTACTKYEGGGDKTIHMPGQ